jgi:hypothetical protein
MGYAPRRVPKAIDASESGTQGVSTVRGRAAHRIREESGRAKPDAVL